jgi:hypothetical protein
MIGHMQIIEARKNGWKPTAVFLLAGMSPTPHRFVFEDPERALDHKILPSVYVLPEELGGHLDLRFLAGIRVHLQAQELTDEAITLAETAANAGATHVIAMALNNGEVIEYERGEWKAWKS